MLMVALLLLVTIGSSLLGVYLLESEFETQQARAAKEAQHQISEFATSVGNQIAFYQGIVDIAARRQQVVDLLAFAEEDDAISWSLAMRSLLPHAMGAAIAHSDGEIIGDPLVQRVGEHCRLDIEHYAVNDTAHYPPVHTGVPGLEHFDIMARIDAQGTEDQGVLMISFQLDAIERPLSASANANQVLSLNNPDQQLLATGPFDASMTHYSSLVPGTDWTVHLYEQPATAANPWLTLLIGDIAILGLVAIIISVNARRYSQMITDDVAWIHQRLASLIQGNFHTAVLPPKTQEVTAIIPDIEKLADQLQQQTESLRTQTLTDPLTGLHNRRHFDVILDHAFVRSQRQAAEILLLIDVNKFKTVNDTLGHKAGDKMLQAAAEILKNLTRSGDEVARLGGDEFAIVLHEMPSQEVENWLLRFVARYDKLIEKHRSAQLDASVCSLSIGAAPISQSLFDRAGDVFEAADLALYAAKTGSPGHSRFRIDPAMPRVASYINTASTTNLRSVPGDKLSNG